MANLNTVGFGFNASGGGSSGGGVQSVVAGTNISVDNTDPENPIVSSTADDITVVANFSALPAPATVTGQFYWCSASQGTAWLPFSLGGTYYSAGLYYSNGVSWEFMSVPYQATQSTVNTGTNDNQFVTPLTFTNATKWSTKQDTITVLSPVNGGTGIANNVASTITITGAFATTFTVGATTSVTLPDSGTLYGTKTGSITSAQLLNSLTNPTGTGVAVFDTAPTFTTSITTPLIIGGTGAGSFIDHTSTTGTGTTTGLAWRLNGGTNGATNIINVYNDGQYLLGTTTRNPTALGTFRIGQGTSTVDIGEVASGQGALWITQTTPSTTNYALKASSTVTTINASSSIVLAIANATRVTVANVAIAFSTGAASSGVQTAFSFSPTNATAQTAGTEVKTLDFVTRNIQHASNTAITTQRDYLFNAVTHAFASATGTITDAGTLVISGAPIAGTNAVITNPYSLWVQGGVSMFGGNVKLTQTQTTEVVTSDATVTINVNGTNVKFLIKL